MALQLGRSAPSSVSDEPIDNAPVALNRAQMTRQASLALERFDSLRNLGMVATSWEDDSAGLQADIHRGSHPLPLDSKLHDDRSGSAHVIKRGRSHPLAAFPNIGAPARHQQGKLLGEILEGRPHAVRASPRRPQDRSARATPG